MALSGSLALSSLAPTRLTISASQPLVAATWITTVGQNPGPPAMSGGLGPMALSSSTAFTAWADVPFGAGVGNTGAAAAPVVSGLAPIDATGAAAYPITVTGAWPFGATPACSVVAPLSSVTCAPSGFSLSTGAIGGITQSGGSLQITGYDANGSPSNHLNSNALPIIDFALRQVSDVNAGANDAVNSLAALGNQLFVLGAGLYRYDPSSQAYTRLTNINTGGNDNASLPQIYNNKLFFMASSTNTGLTKLYSWNDTGAGTLQQISNTHPGGKDYVSTDYFKGYVVVNNKLHVFLKNAANQYKLYQYDDTVGTTLLQVSDTTAGASDDVFANEPEKMQVFGTNVVFRGRIPAGHCKVMWYDGAQVVQVSNKNAGTCDDPGNLVAGPDSNLYFTLDAGGNAPGTFFKWSGAAPGTITQVLSGGTLYSDAWIANVHPPLVFNGKIFFGLLSGGYDKLSSYVPGAGSAISVASTAGASATDDPDWLTVYNGKIFFVALNASGAAKLYSYDDVGGAGLAQIADISGSANTDFGFTGSASPKQTYDPFFTVYNGRLYFRANTVATGGGVNTGNPKLFAYDDTTQKLFKVADNSGAAAADFDWTNTAGPAVYGNRLGLVMGNSASHLKVFTLCDPGAGCAP
jgi:hypothetical protein